MGHKFSEFACCFRLRFFSTIKRFCEILNTLNHRLSVLMKITKKALRVISLQLFINEIAGNCYMKQYSFYSKNQAFVLRLFFKRIILCEYSKEPSNEMVLLSTQNTCLN